MTNAEKYQAAMNKITPRAAWKEETLVKMQQLCQQDTPQPRQSEKSKPWAVSRRVWGPLAAVAVFALVMVPLSLQNNHKTEMEMAAARGEGNPNAQDKAVVSEQEMLKKSREYTPSLTGAAEFASDQELPLISWSDETDDMGERVVLLAQTPEELSDANPTRNLPEKELPEHLPVWYAACGQEHSKALEKSLQQVADYLKLPLVQEPVGPMPQGTGAPGCWPNQAKGTLMHPKYDPRRSVQDQPEKQVWQLNADRTHSLTLWSGPQAEGADKEMPYTSEEEGRKADTLAREQFGSMLGLERPAHESNAGIEADGTRGVGQFQHFYYEAGPKGASLIQRFLDYSFKRVYGHMNQSGKLEMVRLVQPPQTPMAGEYPLRSLEDAKMAVMEKVTTEQQKGLIHYTLNKEDIVSWRLEYTADQRNPWVQPIYIFTFQTPLTPKQVQYNFEGMEQYRVYTEYRVSAVAPEYQGP